MNIIIDGNGRDSVQKFLFRFRYLVALFSVVGALLIRSIVVTEFETETPYIFLFLAVAISAAAGGLMAGLTATILGLGSATFFYLQPYHSFLLLQYSDQVHTVAFAIEGFIVSVLCEKLLMAKRRAQQTAAELRCAQEESLRTKIAAEEANLAKSAFLANMSHEIRTPLGAIMGFSDLVVDPETKSAERIRFAAAIRRNGELLSNIINDILDLSKVEAGKLQIEVHETPLNEILSDVRTLLSLQAEEKGVALTIAIEADVPQIITTDPLRLRQILINIVGNAVKFTTHGFVNVTVRRLSGANDRGQLAFIVQDTGKGVSSDQISKLFHAFSQTDDTSKRKFGGTGLGLVLAKRLAVLLGGDTVLTHSEFGKGSTFTVTIDPGPVYLSPRSQLVGEKSFATKDQGPSLQGIRVLLADDSPDNQMLVGRILQQAGASVETAGNGQEAVHKALRSQYDVVLMDLQMPVMDGYEATAELRKDGYAGKIAALTAHALADEKARCLSSGFDDHISKPISRSVLLERVNTLGKSVS